MDRIGPLALDLLAGPRVAADRKDEERPLALERRHERGAAVGRVERDGRARGRGCDRRRRGVAGLRSEDREAREHEHQQRQHPGDGASRWTSARGDGHGVAPVGAAVALGLGVGAGGVAAVTSTVARGYPEISQWPPWFAIRNVAVATT